MERSVRTQQSSPDSHLQLEAVQSLPYYPVDGGQLILVNPIAKGGYGNVIAADFKPYNGEMPFTAEPGYAVKQMGWGWEHTPTQSLDVVRNPEYKATDYLRTEQEVRAMADKERQIMGLGHPNIVPLAPFAGVDASRNKLYYTMPYASQTLEKWLTRPNLTSYERVTILRQVSAGLQYAHDRGIVHRDVKPTNIFLMRDQMSMGFRAVIGDFGIAVQISPKTKAEEEYKKKPLGTTGYVPFEQYTEDGAVPASDQFALGVVAYQVLTGMLPYNGSDIEIAQQVADMDTPPPTFPSLTGQPDTITKRFLEPVVLRAIAKRPEDRHSSISAFGEALGAALAAAGAECRRQVTVLHDRAAFAENSGQQTWPYYETALALLDEALAANPNDITAMYQKFRSFQRLGRPSEAWQMLNIIVQTPAQNPDDSAARGCAFAHLGDHVQALECYADAQAGRSTLPDIDRLAAHSLEELGRTARQENRTDEAIAHYTQAIANYQRHADRVGMSEPFAVKINVLQQRVDKLVRSRSMSIRPQFSLVAVV